MQQATAASKTLQEVQQTKRPRVGLGVFVERDGRFCLGQRINALGHGEWALPGGHLEFGEHFKECAVREVLEETGLSISNVQLAAVENVVFENGEQHYVVIFMRGQAPAEGEPQVMEPTKCAEWRWCGWDDPLPQPLFQPLKQLLARGFRLPEASSGGS